MSSSDNAPESYLRCVLLLRKGPQMTMDQIDNLMAKRDASPLEFLTFKHKIFNIALYCPFALPINFMLRDMTVWLMLFFCLRIILISLDKTGNQQRILIIIIFGLNVAEYFTEMEQGFLP